MAIPDSECFERLQEFFFSEIFPISKMEKENKNGIP